MFDCIVGTSIGGVIAALLTLPSETDPDKPRYSAAELINMLGQVLSDVFPTDCSSTLRKFANLFCCCLNVSKYSPDGIETLFDQYFNQETLSSTIIPIMITAVGPSNTVKIFSSYDPETKNYNLPDILRATSAAPTYFPPARINGLDYIDGGVLANNPSNIAVRTIKTFTEIPDENISLFYINLDKARESFIIPPNNLLSFYDKASLERFVDGAEKEATANVKNRIGAENFYEFKIHIETQYAVMDNVARDNIRQLKEIGHSACYEKNNQVTLSNFFPGYTWSEEIESEEVESSLLLGNVELIDN